MSSRKTNSFGPSRHGMAPPPHRLPPPDLRSLTIGGLLAISALGYLILQTPEVKTELHRYKIGCFTDTTDLALHTLIFGDNDFRLKVDSPGNVIYGLPGEPIRSQDYTENSSIMIINTSEPKGESETFTLKLINPTQTQLSRERCK